MNIRSLLPGNRTLLRDSTGVFIGNMVGIGMGVLTSVILARTLSIAGMGHYQLIVSYLAIAQIAALPGMNVIVNKAAVKGHDSLFYPVLKRSMASAGIFSAILMLAGALLHFTGVSEIIAMNLLVVGFFLPVLGMEKHDPVFLGKKRFGLSRQMNIYSSTAGTIIIGTIAYATKDVSWVIAGLFATRALTVGIGFWLASRCLKDPPIDAGLRREYLRQGWLQTGFTVFGTVVAHVDKLILGSMSVQLLAIYYVGAIMPGRIKDNLKALFGVTVTHWSALPRRENFEKIRRHWPRVALLGAAISAGIYLSAPLLIPLLYGRDYAPAVKVAQLLALSLPINMVSSLILNADIFQNNGTYFNLQSLVRQIGYLILLAVLVPRYGYFGVISAILAAEVGSGIASIVYFLKQLKRA